MARFLKAVSGTMALTVSFFIAAHDVKTKQRPEFGSVKSDFDETLHGKNYMPKIKN